MSSRIFFLAVLLLFVVPAQAGVPHVVVSIAPIHSLVAGVMDGVSEPELLVEGNSSPHSYMLKPSQVRSLQRADVIVWVGKSVEGFLPRTLANLGANNTVIELMTVPDMVLLPAREGGVWQEEQGHHEGHGHSHGETDGHLWLSPENARVIVNVVAKTLSILDSENASRYQSNAEQLQQQLSTLDQKLTRTLAPLSKTPYLVLHDGYQYFEAHYGLNSVGAIMVDVDRKPGVRRLKEIRERVKTLKVRCVFSEPQFPDRLIKVVTEGAELKSSKLDPMGATLAPGKQLYFELMQNMGDSLHDCLG